MHAIHEDVLGHFHFQNNAPLHATSFFCNVMIIRQRNRCSFLTLTMGMCAQGKKQIQRGKKRYGRERGCFRSLSGSMQ